MMRFIQVAVAVLSLLSVGRSAPVTSCESLIQPLEINGTEQFLGKWMLVAESTNNQGANELIQKFQGNMWTKFTAAEETDAVVLMGSSKVFGLCISVTAMTTWDQFTSALNTINESRTHTVPPELHQNSVDPGLVRIPRLLKTSCSDCLLLRFPDTVLGEPLPVIKQLLLLSKRATLLPAELKEFKEQSECLNLLQPLHFNPETDVCPEPPSPDTDMPRFFVNGQMTDPVNLLENITSSIGGTEKFLNMFTETILKGN